MFDFQAAVGAYRNQHSSLACARGWLASLRNLLLFGPSGVGKGHSATDSRKLTP